MTTDGYTRLNAPSPEQSLVHVRRGADELNRVYQADLAILSGVTPFRRAVSALNALCHLPGAYAVKARAKITEAWAKPVAAPGAVNPSDIFAWLNTRLPADAILANGAGNYAGWLHRFYLYRGFPTLLGPTSGAMGYGVPASVAAKIVHPERIVISCAGDGCFLMNGQELATAVQYDAAIIVLVFDNGMYGTIRMHQERELSRPRHRHRSEESRFRGTGARLWRGGVSLSRAPRISRTPSNRPSPQTDPRLSTSASIPKRSRPRRR